MREIARGRLGWGGGAAAMLGAAVISLMASCASRSEDSQAVAMGTGAAIGSGGGTAAQTGGQMSSGGSPSGGSSLSGGSSATGGGATTTDGGLVMTDAAAPPMGGFEVRALSGLPSYKGSLNNGEACETAYQLAGFEPVGDGGHPLFLYFVGTLFVPGTPANDHDGLAPMAVAEAMARRGFVALSAQYDNGPVAWLSDHQNQLSCMFDATRPESLISVACGLPQVDCGRGVATWGHSQGGLVAVKAHDYDDRVRAAWCTGYGGDGAPTLPRDRLLSVNGENDPSAARETMDALAGFASDRCAADAVTCLRDNGSGWILVRQEDLADPAAREPGHCWFDRDSCSTGALALEPNWVDPASDKAFALERNADWLASMVRGAAGP